MTRLLTVANNPRNIFVVLPNIVYKFLGEKMIKKMKKLAKADFNFIFTQEDLKDDIKMLKETLTKDQMKYIDKISKRVEEKYQINFSSDDD